MKNENSFCKGDGFRFDINHRHHAKGYCFNEYQKMRYQQKPKLPIMPRTCKAHGILFGPDHRHYAKGYCRYAYYRIRRDLYTGPYYCPKCTKYFPDEPANKVLRLNALCERCIPIINEIIERGKKDLLKNVPGCPTIDNLD